MNDPGRHVPDIPRPDFDRLHAIVAVLPAQDALRDICVAVPLAVVMPWRGRVGLEVQEANPALVVVERLLADDTGREAGRGPTLGGSDDARGIRQGRGSLARNVRMHMR